MKKKIVVTTLIILVLAATLGAAGAQPAQAAPLTQLSDGWMPFAGILQDAQTNSHISINGLVHILAHWQSLPDSQVQVDISANLTTADVSVTTDTGVPYSASGAGQSSASRNGHPLP